MEQSPWEADSSLSSPSFMEPEGTVSCSQEPANGPYPELDKSNLRPPNLFP
jgi:hypothetical protein